MKKLLMIMLSLILSVYLFAACAKNLELSPGDLLPPETDAAGPDGAAPDPIPPDDDPSDQIPPDDTDPPDVTPPDGTEDPDETPPVETPDVPEPTPEPEPEVPVVKKDVLIRSNTDSLSVRSGPGTGYGILGTLDKNDMAGYLSTTGNWHRIVFKKGIGYVSAAYTAKAEFETGSAAVERVIEEGKKLLGLPYVFGAQRYHWGNGERNAKFDGKSFDCSSLTQYAYKVGAGVNIATTSREQSLQGKYAATARRGDLMFFTNDSRKYNTGIERIGHVAIYLGDNYILHTASDHAVIEPISSKRWSYYITARRFL